MEGLPSPFKGEHRELYERQTAHGPLRSLLVLYCMIFCYWEHTLMGPQKRELFNPCIIYQDLCINQYWGITKSRNTTFLAFRTILSGI